MAALTGTIIAIAGLAVSAGAAYAQYENGKDAQRAQQQAADEQRKARGEEAAINAAKASQERRQQIRDERIRRGQIVNASANTGTSDSSGMAGALGSMSTQLGANMGFNQGMYMAGQRIGRHNQNAADFNANAQSAANRASMWGSVGGVGQSIFGAAGGWGTLGAAYDRMTKPQQSTDAIYNMYQRNNGWN